MAEITTARSTLWKTRKWHWMSGAALPIDWNTTDVISTNIFRMNDEINGGFEIVGNPASATSQGIINYNGIEHYDFDNCIFIGDMERFTASTSSGIGLNFGTANFTAGNSHVAWFDDTSQTFKILNTSDGTAQSNIASDVAVNTILTNYKLELNGTNVLGSLDGILKITKSTNYPTEPLTPAFQHTNRATGVRESRCIFMEAFNP